MWWATQTVTTVGYGDVVPDPGAGKLIATILMIGGLSLFAVITGLITSGFVAVAQARREVPGAEVARRLEEMTGQLTALKEEMARLSGDRDDPA